MKLFAIIPLLLFLSTSIHANDSTWIRINLLGYTPAGKKIAVWCSKEDKSISTFELVNTKNEVVFTGSAGKAFGPYGPFRQSYRLDFTSFQVPGRYLLRSGGTLSGWVNISRDVYNGAADFCLRYMRQQRTGFNPYLKDSCHTQDGYVLYGEKAGIPDSTFIDVTGGWHDASDYLQYSTTSANATYHLLMAWRDFPGDFKDEKLANGLDGKNGIPDLLDEAKWGLDWLLKMHPKDEWMFNQIADDRDHMGMRMPKLDSFYGRGHQRPVYFVSGEPQQRGKYMNNTTGTSSTAGKFSSAFALGSRIFLDRDKSYAHLLKQKSESALKFGTRKPGVTQTASVLSPYIYAEDNWQDDMELAYISAANLVRDKVNNEDVKLKQLYTDLALEAATAEPITAWLGKDTAKHYQWYPFINIGHYELAKQLTGKEREMVVGYYREGIQRVWNKASANAFYRGVPFIWCSNNLTVAFAMQCFWYRELANDQQFAELEQANFDWLLGCNPWGTSMVYGLPGMYADTPEDPHSAFTHIKQYPVDGGLVDGPVYGSIFKSLIGIQLKDADEYAPFQSDLAVYHDDYGDYSTNEPTMDGTASLIYLLAAKRAEAWKENKTISQGAVIRGDSTRKTIALVFTADEFTEGGPAIREILKAQNVRASFFLTGRAYRNKKLAKLIGQLKNDHHYLGPHSDQHLLYCDWNKRDSLLVTIDSFKTDLQNNYKAMEIHGIHKTDASYFIPPYEWYNKKIVTWAKEQEIELVNMTPGTRSHADYTTPSMKNYVDCETIMQSVRNYEAKNNSGLNGFLLLMHLGTDPARKDKCYHKLSELIDYLKSKGYHFQTINELLAY